MVSRMHDDSTAVPVTEARSCEEWVRLFTRRINP
jgi:hypothetical protein